MTDDTITDLDQCQPDKFEQHYRLQLSALMDGALPPDEARFLLRRLQHDAQLAECLDRWHMAGDALRGQAQAIVGAEFAERVAAMVASEPALNVAAAGGSRANRGVMRWAGGAALAASVALVALFMTRQPSTPDPVQAGSTIAEASMPVGAGGTPVASSVPRPTAGTPAASSGAEFVPAVTIATASTPVRSSIRRGNRSQSQRAAIRTLARSGRPMVAAASTQPNGTTIAANVFDTPASSRPWPSAVFPQASTMGSFNVDYGNASSPTFYPFAPRLPDEPPRDNGETQPVDDASSP